MPQNDPHITDQFHRPLRDLRVSVTDRCNFRCPYCMPAEIFGPSHAFLRAPQLMAAGELARILRAFVSLGVEKLRFTGGEPLLRPDITELIHHAKNELRIPDIALTTNAWLLTERAPALRAAGLDRLNISLDALSPATFARMSGRSLDTAADPARVLHAIDTARALGFPIKLNTVLQRGVNDTEIIPLAAYARERRLTIRFIEFMDAGNHNHWTSTAVVHAREILDTISARWPLEPAAPTYRGEVAARHRYRDGAGEIGIISAITEPFCRDCNRARISADGHLYTCLFATAGLDLLAPLRAGETDEALRSLIKRVWTTRADRYSDERAKYPARRDTEKIEMSYIGG